MGEHHAVEADDPQAAPACSCGGGGGPDCGCGVDRGDASPVDAPATPAFVYAIGRVQVAFPSASVKQEFDQQISRVYPPPPTNVPDLDLAYEILRQGQNLYLARAMCWLLQIDGVYAYVLKPRTYVELFDLISSLEPGQSGQRKFDVIIGPRGPLAGPDECAGLQLPMVVVNQDYYFTYDEFVQAMSDRTGVDAATVSSMFDAMLEVADNAGETDEHRALNYVTVRYPGVYSMAGEMLAADDPHSLTRVTARPGNVQGARRLVDVVFQFTQRSTGELAYRYCRVDVTGQFPFLVTKMSNYYPAP